MRIGVFDSGVGGVTVLKNLIDLIPGHEYLYFGDTAHVPYGTKSPHQIQTLVRNASETMKSKGIEALVIACNTAASLGMDQFKAILDPIPILHVVEAGLTSVQNAMENPSLPILILGTRATIRSKIYSEQLHGINPSYEIYEQECPLLVPMIEEGWLDHPALDLTVQEYVKKYRLNKPGIALLACTHYPWIRSIFEAHLPGWKVLDSGKTLSQITKERLGCGAESNELNPHEVRWLFSDPESIARNLLTLL